MDRTDLEKATEFVNDKSNAVPQEVINIVLSYSELVKALEQSTSKLRSYLRTIRMAFKIEPSSEKRKKNPEELQNDKDLAQKIGKLAAQSRKLLGKITRLKASYRLIQSGEKARSTDTPERDAAKANNAASTDTAYGTGPSTSGSNEQNAQSSIEGDVINSDNDKADPDALFNTTFDIIQNSEGFDPAFNREQQNILTIPEPNIIKKVKVVEPEVIPEGEIIREINTNQVSKRIDASFDITITEVIYKKYVVKLPSGETTIVNATGESLGPKNSNVTWNFLSQLVLFNAGTALPINRIAMMLSTPGQKISSGAVCNHLRYVAERFMPIYLCLFKQLANSEYLMGDDTTFKVLEVSRQAESKDNPCAPWHYYETMDEAENTLELLSQGSILKNEALLEEYKNRGLSIEDIINLDNKFNKLKDKQRPCLEAELAAQLGFVYPRKDGKGPKKGFNVSVLSGRVDINDPSSRIVFYRSHFGSFGDLVATCLSERSSLMSNKVIIQSDLCAANGVKVNNIDIIWIGCADHARRPFKRFAADDPEICANILTAFHVIYGTEELMNEQGKNAKMVLEVRNFSVVKAWEYIREQCEILKQKWSSQTELGKAARYIIKNYKFLTAYLQLPYAEIANIFCERMLRLEKCIKNASYFKNSLRGRFEQDIFRTILQTCAASGAPPTKYLEWVLRSDPNQIKQHPEKFTPYAFAKSCAS